MPSVASIQPPMATISSLFPLTSPIPTPLTHPDLVSTSDVTREEDLLRNPFSFRHWWTAIQASKDSFAAQLKLETPPSEMDPAELALLGPLALPTARLSLQRLTYLYESALAQFPRSFKLWKSYLHMRMSYVCGKFIHKKRAGGKKKFPEMKEALEDEKEDLEEWEGGLDGAVGYQEWKSLVATFERALMWLPNLPRLWLLYLSIFLHPECPAPFCFTHARRTFDRALRTLPPSLHSRVWVRYLLWAESIGGATCVAVYRRYLGVDPSVTEHYVSLLLSPSNPDKRPLEAAKLLLSLARKAQRGEFTSLEGKSAHQLFVEWLEVVENYAEEVGIGVDESIHNQQARDKADADANAATGTGKLEPPASVNGSLIRMSGPPVPVSKDGKFLPPYDEDEDPTSSRKLDVERIVEKDGLNVYKDQAGRLWTGLATYWIKRGEFDRATSTFERGLAASLTVRDFTQIIDAYAEYSESLISALVEALADLDDEDEDKAETEREADERMRAFEDLMDRRPFLLNDVLLRRNPNDVQEWEKRVALWGKNDTKIVKTYEDAMLTINPKKATANFHRLCIEFARFYEEGGSTGEAEKDLDSARKIFERATKINFRAVEDLAEIWCEWAEMELRHDNYDEAVRVMQRAAAVPKNPKVDYHDHSLPVQARLFKSLKLWSFYVDLEESIGTVDTAKLVYDKILELRIANAQIIINYAAFLEENKYFEESFKVYERGVELFTFPVAFEIWNIYLSKFVKRYGGNKLERTRDLFEQALEQCPSKFCKPLYLMYARLEEEHGLAKRAMSIYERSCQAVSPEDRFEMYTIYIAKAAANFGLPATRPIYERALEVLPDKQTAQVCIRFAQLERKLGEIDRARAIYAHASQFCDPRVMPDFWKEWYDFEIETGSEDTFREMLRIKRSVQAQFNTEASFLTAQTLAARKGAAAEAEKEAADTADPMAAIEREAGGGKQNMFVPATQSAVAAHNEGDKATIEDQSAQQNEEEIHISDDDAD